MSADEARETVGLRFLADPSFTVKIDGRDVQFADIPERHKARSTVDVPGLGLVRVMVLDTLESDRTSKQHGVAWRVQGRLVGEVTWKGSDEERILDGRTRLAKRLTFIVEADFLRPSVLTDWTGFKPQDPAWLATNSAVQAEITRHLRDLTKEERSQVTTEVKAAHVETITRLPPSDAARWTAFVEQVAEECPSLTTKQLSEVAGILAKLAYAASGYELLERLHKLDAVDLDSLNEILKKWTVESAKKVLDELEWRLKLIEELRALVDDPTTLEVQRLQPLMERCLWMFGPEFDAIDYTSNEGMTKVINLITGTRSTKGSLQRPDFVITHEGTAGFYSHPRYGDDGHPVEGVGKLIIVELKKPEVTIGESQKRQPWGYAKELFSKGILVKGRDPIHAWVLGTSIDPNETSEFIEAEGKFKATPIRYDTLLDRAHARTFSLFRALRNAPFLAEESEGDATIHPVDTQLLLSPAPSL